MNYEEEIKKLESEITNINAQANLEIGRRLGRIEAYKSILDGTLKEVVKEVVDEKLDNPTTPAKSK